MTILRRHQVLFTLIFVLAGSFAVLSEKGILPVGYLGGHPQLQYALDVLCTAFCMGGTIVLLRLMAFKNIKADLVERGEEAYFHWDGVRLLLMAVCVLTEVLVYYATLKSRTAHYALMVSLMAAVFCIPTKRELERLTCKDKEL